jgi:hypothetical protein
MTAVGCGIVEVNLPQHSIKQREKCGLGPVVPHSQPISTNPHIVSAKLANART